MKTITESNKLIAKFMDIEIEDDRNMQLLPSQIFAHDLNYHFSWDWLMPVVEKIESLKLNHYEVGKTTPYLEIMPHSVKVYYYKSMCSYVHGLNGQPIKFYYNDPTLKNEKNHCESKIQAVYKAVIEFIKWYNENNK